MKRWIAIFLLALVGLTAVSPAFAGRRVVVRRGPHRRTVVVVHRGWPLRRPLRSVYIRPARVAWRVAPAVFLPMVV